MLILGKSEPFARGSHRACYYHPVRKDCCVKVMSYDWRTSNRLARTHWLAKLYRPKWYFHENLKEYHFSQKLKKRIGDKGREYVPQVHEVLETDRGDGMIVDLITDHDGSLALTLSEYLWEFGLTESCQDALDRMWEGVEKYRIFVQGRPDNLVVRQNVDGSCHCYAIDGFGLAQLIPLAKWIPSITRKRFRQRKAKQQRSIQKLLEQRAAGEAGTRKGFRL